MERLLSSEEEESSSAVEPRVLTLQLRRRQAVLGRQVFREKDIVEYMATIPEEEETTNSIFSGEVEVDFRRDYSKFFCPRLIVMSVEVVQLCL